MSGKLKEVRERMKSVKSTQQITKAMKMVSAAKLRRATEAIQQMRPYSNKLSEILNNILISQEGQINLDLAVEREVKNVLLVVYTSDRGLCGAFNTNVIKKAVEQIRTKYADIPKANLHVMTIGKKSNAYFSKYNCTVNSKYVNLLQERSFEETAQAAEFAINGFIAGDFDVVELVYAQFKNAAVQTFMAEPFLPLVKQETTAATDSKNVADFIFEPNETDIIKVLIPKILKTQFYKALLDTNASEHGARMTAMDKATDNAQELLKELGISYNRARQAAITTELTEIVSGAAALEAN